MDRLQFIEQIDQGKFVCSSDAIIQFFDHNMAAYNLIGQYSGFSVCSKIDSPLCMTFHISFQEENQAVTMENHISNHLNNRMDLYGKIFNINSRRINSGIDIQILQLN